MSFAGIDCSEFPGLDMLAVIKGQTNVTWLGYYLDAPSHPNSGWCGQRGALDILGFGLAPIFVGQEVIGPGSHVVSGQQGTADGLQAASEMADEGFAPSTCVFLDIENGGPISAAQMSYIASWTATVRREGYSAGLYCSHTDAAFLAAAHPLARIWAWNLGVNGNGGVAAPLPTPDVSACGYARASIWQRAQNVTLLPYGLQVDLDVATTADPGAPLDA